MMSTACRDALGFAGFGGGRGVEYHSWFGKGASYSKSKR